MPEKKKRRKCKCGRYLKKTDEKFCEVCVISKELERYKKDYEKLRTDNSQCQMKNRELMKKVSTLEQKKSYPCWFEIKPVRWNCNEKYLEKLLSSVAPVSDCIQVEYGRNL